MFDWLTSVTKDLDLDTGCIATGNTPDGILHIGALREQLIGDAIFKSAKNNIRNRFVVYDQDGLKADNAGKSFRQWVGTPIYKVPCPCGKCASYADHYLMPYLDALKSLRVDCEIVRTSELYEKGCFSKYIHIAIEKATRINQLLGREPQVSPFLPICPSCGKYCYAATTGARFSCSDCKTELQLTGCDIPGKLRWEVEWAAIWAILEVKIEPVGQAHTSLKGRSYERSSDIASFVFQIEPPEPLFFGVVRVGESGCDFLKDAQCCKRNIQMTYADWSKVASPELLKYLMINDKLSHPVLLSIREHLPRYMEDFYDFVYRRESEFALPASWLESAIPAKSFLKECILLKKPVVFPSNKISDTQVIRRARHWIEIWKGQIPISSIAERVKMLTNDEKAILLSVFEVECPESNYSLCIQNTTKQFALSTSSLFKLIYWTLTGEIHGEPLSKIVQSNIFYEFKSIIKTSN